MKMDLVLSRGCRHVDWCTIPQTSTEFCKSCGFALIFDAGHPAKDAYAEVQVQPRSGATFDPARKPPLGACSYKYPSLNLVHGRQIRVLVLKAGQPDDPLRCELKHVNLQQGPIYEAVSYTWADEKGDDTICRKIQCGHGDQFLGITKNCEAALLRLRKRDADRRLWVDAVCIDQSNVEERNHQVKNMIVIFRSALRVLVFLGERSPILGRLVDHISNDTAGQLPQVLDFISLFQSRWFHRVWVLQEVAVAKSVLVIYGTKQMSWKDLIEHSNLFLRLMAARNFPLVLPPAISYSLQQTIGNRRLEGKSDLLSLLQVSRNCSCTDARNKVYAILGLLQDESVLPLQANYSRPTKAGWVFLQAAAWHISTTKSLEILSHVDGMSAINMPSWVPDWTRKSPASLPAKFKVLKESSVPRFTSLDRQPLSSTATLNYPLDCVLQVTGQRCGTVWTDRRIFGKALVPSKSASHATHSYSREGGGHWLHNPSQNPGSRCCGERLDFWGQILSLYPSAIPSADFKADYTTFQADIPPSFGGLCRNCFERDKMYWQMIQRAGSRPECCCVFPKSSLRHFDKDELEDFLAKMNQYGMNRRIFGTDHSIGFGPMELKDWDEVWILEGARVPFILRRVDNHYKLVGACYVQAASRTTDRCSVCSYETVRKEITLRPELRARPAVGLPARIRPRPWIDSARSTPLVLTKSKQSRLFNMEDYQPGFKEPLTGALPGRLEEIEIR